MRVLLAPDRFGGNLTATAAAVALARGWSATAPPDAVTTLPLSDGSAGLLDVVAAAGGGGLIPTTVPGPLGEPVPAAVLHVPGPGGGTVYVEADQALGPHLLPPADRRAAARTGTSAGLGHLLAAAVDTGAARVVVGLGPRAATHDAGAGLLAALAGGAAGRAPSLAAELTAGGLALGALTPPAAAAALGAARDRLAGADVVLAVADDAPLLGLHGAGAILGGDPDVGPAAAQDLERALGHAADVLQRAAETLPAPRRGLPLLAGAGERGGGPAAAGDGRDSRLGVVPDDGASPHAGHHHPGPAATARPAGLARADRSGAGGGAALALLLLGARALPGADVVADAVGLGHAVAAADLVLTGARVLDAPSLTASVVATVARAALPHALPVVVVAEEVHTSRREVSQIGVAGTYEVLERRREDPPADPPGPAALTARAARLARTWSP
ncbi:glycerate kinase [Georgenia sp. TF02-10]|uniref:glycerate kinase n=1 Tax=Georgenia sp. TF02-10 TaxID=2917725 RepID=UPI001FA7B5EA|nr:glycerate kinase [Georgenia sp. TF02-10]UNX53427.1 glycerate kinase [Georgenia sp. TF02-10]